MMSGPHAEDPIVIFVQNAAGEVTALYRPEAKTMPVASSTDDRSADGDQAQPMPPCMIVTEPNPTPPPLAESGGAEPAIERPFWRRPVVFLVLAAVVLAASLATVLLVSKRPLAQRDPAGALACQQLADWQIGKDPGSSLLASVGLADQVARAATESIHATLGEPVFDDKTLAELSSGGRAVTNIRFVDLQKLHAACVAEGVDMPPWSEPR